MIDNIYFTKGLQLNLLAGPHPRPHQYRLKNFWKPRGLHPQVQRRLVRRQLVQQRRRLQRPQPRQSRQRREYVRANAIWLERLNWSAVPSGYRSYWIAILENGRFLPMKYSPRYVIITCILLFDTVRNS